MYTFVAASLTFLSTCLLSYLLSLKWTHFIFRVFSLKGSFCKKSLTVELNDRVESFNLNWQYSYAWNFFWRNVKEMQKNKCLAEYIYFCIYKEKDFFFLTFPTLVQVASSTPENRVHNIYRWQWCFNMFPHTYHSTETQLPFDVMWSLDFQDALFHNYYLNLLHA